MTDSANTPAIINSANTSAITTTSDSTWANEKPEFFKKYIDSLLARRNSSNIILFIVRLLSTIKHLDLDWINQLISEIVKKYNETFKVWEKTGEFEVAGYGDYKYKYPKVVQKNDTKTFEELKEIAENDIMPQKWHPAPSMMNQISPNVFKLCDEYNCKRPETLFELYNVCGEIYWMCFKTQFDLSYYMKLRIFTTHDTKTDDFPQVYLKIEKKGKMSFACANYTTFCELFSFPKNFSPSEKNKKFKKWQQECSILAKLIHTLSGPFYGAYMRATSAIIDKTGILTYVIDHIKKTNNYDISFDVFIFLQYVVSDFSRRKMFTLEEQKQGSLNPFLDGLYSKFSFETLTEIDKLLICSVLPTRAHVKMLSIEMKKIFADIITNKLKELSVFLDLEMSKGGLEALSRGGVVHARSHGTNVGMRVNSTAWNASSGAFNNLFRLWLYLYEACPVLFSQNIILPVRIPCLLAHDQFRWAQESEKECKIIDDCKILFDRTHHKFDPFGAILGREAPFAWITNLKQICKTNDIDEKRWVPRPFWDDDNLEKKKDHKKQDAEFVQPDSLICGIAVPSELAEPLKEMGAFGYNKGENSTDS